MGIFMGIRLFVFCVLGMLFSNAVHAAPPACNAGSEGTIVYNKDRKLVQFCNGTDWIGMVAKIGGAGDTLSDLTCASGEVPEWNGTAWICGAGGTGLWTDSGNGYLTYTGTDTGIKVQSIAGMSAPTNTLADLGCANNEILKWDGDSWECAADTGGISALTGEVTASGTGSVAATIAANAVTNAKMADDAVGIAELSATGTASASTYLRGDNTWATISSGLPSLTSANIWVGNGSNAATAVAMSGDATINNAGVLTIGSNAVGSTEITNASIALADLSATGTASATTYLRGDNTWATIAGGSDNLGDHIATQVLRSDTHNTDDLGTTAIRWKDGWFAGTVTAGTFAGSGASLTALPAANLTGALPAISGANLTSLNATNLGSGTVPAARMPALTGDVTMAAGTTATNIASAVVGTTELSATGTKNTTTFLRGDNTWATTLTGPMTAQMFYHTSDERLKTNVKQIADPMAFITALRGVRYDWKADNKPAFGFIAQEVETIAPEAVITGTDGMKAVEYDQIIAPLVEAVKAQQALIEAQNARIEKLERALDQRAAE
jgi:hypothetical protein